MGRQFAKKINKMYNKESIIFSRGRIKAYKVMDISCWILSLINVSILFQSCSVFKHDQNK